MEIFELECEILFFWEDILSVKEFSECFGVVKSSSVKKILTLSFPH